MGKTLCPASKKRRKRMRRIHPRLPFIFCFTFAMCFLLSEGTAFADGIPQVKTDKDVYTEGEKIRVNFFNAPGYSRDWICITASGSADTDAGDYQYMPHGQSQGVLTFEAPVPGKYEVRAYYNYSRNGYVVSARHSFTVAAKDSPAAVVSPPAKPVAQPPVAQPSEKLMESIPTEDFSVAGGPANVAIFHFTPLSMDASHYGITVTNVLINSPGMQQAFLVLPKKDLELFLSANNLQQNDEVDNMVDIGTRLGMNFVIAGTITKRGSTISTSYKIASVAGRGVIHKGQFTSSGEADLIHHIEKMSEDVIAVIRRSVR
jgi:TolB-like protein